MWRNIARFPDARRVPGIEVVRFDAQLYFANMNHFHVRPPILPHSHVFLSFLFSCMLSCRLLSAFFRCAPRRPLTSVVWCFFFLSFFPSFRLVSRAPCCWRCRQTRLVESARYVGDQRCEPPYRTILSDLGLQRTPRRVHHDPDTFDKRCKHVPRALFPRGTRHLVIDMSVVSSVDFSAMDMLTELPADLRRAGLGHVRIWLVNMRGPVRDAMRRMLHEEEREAEVVIREHQKAVRRYARSMSVSGRELAALAAATPKLEHDGHELDARLFCLVRGSRWWVVVARGGGGGG